MTRPTFPPKIQLALYLAGPVIGILACAGYFYHEPTEFTPIMAVLGQICLNFAIGIAITALFMGPPVVLMRWLSRHEAYQGPLSEIRSNRDDWEALSHQYLLSFDDFDLIFGLISAFMICIISLLSYVHLNDTNVLLPGVIFTSICLWGLYLTLCLYRVPREAFYFYMKKHNT